MGKQLTWKERHPNGITSAELREWVDKKIEVAVKERQYTNDFALQEGITELDQGEAAAIRQIVARKPKQPAADKITAIQQIMADYEAARDKLIFRLYPWSEKDRAWFRKNRQRRLPSPSL